MLQRSDISRREFLSTATGALAGCAVGVTFYEPAYSVQKKPRAKVERLGIGAIGMRYQGSVITQKAIAHGDVVAIADVDRHVREQARASFGSTPRIFEDYRDLLKRKDLDVVLIAAPDHWHTKMLIDACRAGKDVYCEKPLTLTIDEGKLIRKVVTETRRVVQVGTWQRSDFRFRLAAEMVRAGRIGQLFRVTCTTDKNPTGGPFEIRKPPKHLNWDLWQGQTPDVPYIPERSHYTFRWWYEYSGGKMTDWGAHHIDIAQWAVNSLPVAVEGKAKLPKIKNGYNVASDFEAEVTYANDVELFIKDEGRRGILFEGDKARLFVNRGKIDGKPVHQLKEHPLPREKYTLYQDNLSRRPQYGKLDAIISHMGNFFDCVHSRKTPVSDVESQHRSVCTCHLANISMRLGRKLKWDPKAERFEDDKEADGWLKREQRKGFEII